MSDGMIQIIGVTDENDYPRCSENHPCIEICETDRLSIPCQKPNMEDIIEIFVSVSIASFDLICTPQGKKLVIDGLKHIKIIYTAEGKCENVHCAHFDIPFCSFILLKDRCENIISVKTAIEHISVYKENCREFFVSLVMFICPEFKRHSKECEDNEEFENKYEFNKESHHKQCQCNEKSSPLDCHTKKQPHCKDYENYKECNSKGSKRFDKKDSNHYKRKHDEEHHQSERHFQSENQFCIEDPHRHKSHHRHHRHHEDYDYVGDYNRNRNNYFKYKCSYEEEGFNGKQHLKKPVYQCFNYGRKSLEKD